MAVSLAGEMFALLRFKPTKASCPTPGAKVGSCHRTNPSMSRDQVRKGWAGALARAEATIALIQEGNGPGHTVFKYLITILFISQLRLYKKNYFQHLYLYNI